MQSILALSAILALLPLAGQAEQSGPASKKVAKPTKDSQKALTGCLDEQNGQYVLTDVETLRMIAALEAQAFPQEGFAKHVGEKVTVRGAITSNGDRTVMRVRSIQKLSEKCAPSNGNPQ